MTFDDENVLVVAWTRNKGEDGDETQAMRPELIEVPKGVTAAQISRGVAGDGASARAMSADADGVVRRRGGCLTNVLYGAEDPDDQSVPPRRRGGVLGLCLGDPDPETNARRGGVLGACLGDEDPDRPGERGRRDQPGFLLGAVLNDGDGGTPRRRGGVVGACLGDEDQKTGARKGGCLAACVGDEDPETGRRRGGCLSGCLFGDDDNEKEKGCLAGCDEDSDWGTGSSEDELDRDRDPSRRARPERTCLAECLRALCGSSEASRRRRRRRRRRAREARIAAAGEKEAGADAGPPFSVPDNEVRRLYEPLGLSVRSLGSEECLDTAPPRMRERLASMRETVYLVEKPRQQKKRR